MGNYQIVFESCMCNMPAGHPVNVVGHPTLSHQFYEHHDGYELPREHVRFKVEDAGSVFLDSDGYN